MEKRGERLLEILKDRNMSERELAKISGIGQSTINSMIRNNFKDSSIDRIIKIAESLDVKVHDFIPEAEPITDPVVGSGQFLVAALKHLEDIQNTDEKYKLYEEASRAMSMKEVNYLGQVAAGERSSIICESNSESIELPKFIFGKYANKKDIFVMKAFGDSMNKIIPDGSFVICAPISNHTELNDGDIVIYTYENESSIKRYHEKKNHIVFSPESHNRDFFDFVISKETINTVQINAKIIAYHVILE